MAQTDNAFDVTGAAADDSADVQRRRKLSSFNLQSWYNDSTSPDASAELQEQPLHAGTINRNTASAAEAAGVGEPSQLATERVKRAPVIEEASPLLGIDERVGNVLTGEEGSYGPLEANQRQNSLKELFRQPSSASSSSDTSRDVGGAGEDAFASGLNKARQAAGYARTADKLSGDNADDWLKSLFKRSGSAGGAFSTGPTLGPDDYLGGAQGPSSYGDVFMPPGLGEPRPTMGPTNFIGNEQGPASYGDVFAPQPAAPTTAPTNATGGMSQGGSALGTGASALALLANLYSLYQSRGGDLSPSQFVNLIQSSGGALASLGSLAGGTIAPLTSGAATGLAGAGGSAVGAGLSTAGQALGGIGTTLGIGMNLASLARALETGDDRALGAPVGSLAGLGIGAGVGTLIAPGVGTLIGAGLGAAAGGAIGSVIGQNLPHYYAVRGHSMRLGNEAADQYTTNVINAGYTGDITDVQQALGAGYANGRVRVDLNLPKDVAAAIGVPTNARIADMSSDQFALLLKAYSERAGANSNWFQGSGDVPYLDTKTRGEGDENYSGPTGPGAARAIADHVATTARGTFDILAQALAPQLAQLPPVAPLHWEDVNGTRIAPEIEYTQYNTHTGEPGAGPPTWDPASYDTIKQAAQAGTLSDLFMGGGAGLGTPSQREAAAAQGREYYDRMLHPWLYDPNYFNGSGSGGDSGGGPGAP